MSLHHVVMIGVGAMIGAGIFVLTGIAAGVAGPALVLVFLLNGVVTTLTALSYAELGSCFPEAGGGYLWVKQALPQPSGFLSGWMSWFAHAVACSLYAVAFGAFGAKILSLVPGLGGLEGSAALRSALAVLVTVVFAWINYRGAEETGRAETFVTVVKIVIIAAFCAAGLWAILVRAGSWEHYFTDGRSFLPHGFRGIAVAMGLTFIAFEGYEIIAQCGEEVVDPRRNVPRSIFLSILIVVPIYVVVAFVAVAGVTIPAGYAGPATTSWQYLGELKELAMIEAAARFLPFGALVFLVGGLFSTMSALNATMYSSSRVSFAMARDHNLPAVFARIHPVRRTPHFATMISAALIIAMAVALPIEQVASATDAMFLLLFVLVNIAVLNLRRNRPDLERGFRVPLVPFLPLLAIACNLGLAVFLFGHYRLGTSITLAFILAGVGIYLAYARRREAEAEEREVPTVYQEVASLAEADFRILTPVANPRSIPGLMKLTALLASSRRAEIVLANVVKVPAQLPVSATESLLDEAREMIRRSGDAIRKASPEPRPVTALVKVAHSVPLAISNVVASRRIDLLILGWRGGFKRRHSFFGSVLDETVFNARCDVVMMARPSAAFLDRAKRILVPILFDYRHALLSLDVALALSAAKGIPVHTIHVSERHEVEREAVAEAFAREREALSARIDLSRVRHRIVHAKNVVGTLLSLVKEADLVVVEGLHEGVLSRHYFGEAPERLAREIPNTVILTKKYPGHVLSWVQKFLGTRRPEPHG